MERPFFTVIIPTYNRSDLLRDAIQSVLNQTFYNFELIVVDDASTDNTRNIVNSFNDKRIKYLMNDHAKGGAGARNAGIFKAKGEWIAFLDDDDFWFPDKLKIQRDKIQTVDKLVGLIYTGYIIGNSKNRKREKHVLPEKKGWIINDLLYKNHIGAFSTVCLKASILRSIGGLDERFPANQDLDLYIRVARISKVAYIKNKLVYVRKFHNNRISFDMKKKLYGNLLIFEKYSEIINRSKLLQHRAASRVFVYAILERNLSEIINTLPWIFLGLVIDIPNFIWTVRTTLSLFYKKKIRKSI